MSIATIANRYARALADVVAERGEVNEVMAELKMFTALQAAHPQLRDVFASPTLNGERKRGVLNEILKRLELRPTTNNFLQLLLSNSRLHQLDQMLRALSREIDTRTNIVLAEITTAREIDEQQKNELQSRLKAATGKQVRLHFRTDPAIIGGVVTQIGSLVYDGSVKNQLAQMKQRLLSAHL